MRVTVVMINHNYGRYVGAAIESVLAQTRPADQIVVVDDGSTDDSRDAIRSYPAVKLVEQEQSGVAEATNNAIANSDGDVLVFLDSDDLMTPARLERVLACYDRHPQVEWVWHENQHIDRATQKVLDDPIKHLLHEVQLVDVRGRAAAGMTRLGVMAPATSGLSFRRSLLARLTPMPPLIRSQDGYLKFAALALAPGACIPGLLSLQGIHNANTFTTSAGREKAAFLAENFVAMATGWARHEELAALSDRYVGDSNVVGRAGTLLRPAYRDLTRRYWGTVSGTRRARIVKAALLEGLRAVKGLVVARR